MGFIRDAVIRKPGVIAKLQCIGCGTIAKMVTRPSGHFTQCRCGSLMMSEDGVTMFPQLFTNTLAEGGKQETVEFYVGYSNFMDERKKEVIRQLELGGCKHVVVTESKLAKLKEHLKGMGEKSSADRAALAIRFELPYATVKEMVKE